MFTGIVKELGIVRSVDRSGVIYTLDIESKEISQSVRTGDSIAVNGTCLTVTGARDGVISFDVMKETIRRTNMSALKKKDRVNLEDSLKTGASIDGHFVLGHIDCLGRITGIKNSAQEEAIEIEIPPDFSSLVVEKGSVAVDGVSLTVGGAGRNSFKVYLIPHTLKITTLGFKKVQDVLNIEFDILGKYVLGMNSVKKGPGITESFLKDNGF